MGHFLNVNDTKICTARRWDMEDFFFNRDMVSLHHVIGSKKSRRKTRIYIVEERLLQWGCRMGSIEAMLI